MGIAISARQTSQEQEEETRMSIVLAGDRVEPGVALYFT